MKSTQKLKMGRMASKSSIDTPEITTMDITMPIICLEALRISNAIAMMRRLSWLQPPAENQDD
jgi:hypothetical protein